MATIAGHSLCGTLLLSIIPALIPLQCLGQEDETERLAQMDTNPPCAEYPAWLNEVREQREAWEAHRDSVKQSVGKTPPGVIPDQPLQHQEPPSPDAYYQRRDQRLKESGARRDAHRQELLRQREERERLWQNYPYGWDNPWYYQGY